MVACLRDLAGGLFKHARIWAFLYAALAAFSAYAQGNMPGVPDGAQTRSGRVTAAGTASSPLAVEQKPLSIPPSSIIVTIRRAYVFGSGSQRFCSPEVAVFNQGTKAISVLMVAMDFYQQRSDGVHKVGSTHPRFVVDPGESVMVGFHRLSTDTCEGIYARATTSVCLWRDRSSCEDRVIFSNAGQLPIFEATGRNR